MLNLKKRKSNEMAQKFHFTAEQWAELKRDYATTPSKDLAKRFGCSIHTIHNASYRHGLKKDKEHIQETARKNMTADHPGRKTQFKKGQISFNKGKKQTEYMTPEAIKRTKATRFQTGHIPKNHRPVGSERIAKGGYIQVKLREGLNEWKFKHRVVWEQHHGEIPTGYNIQFKDGNPQNCTLENLYIISHADQLKNENSMYAQYPE